MIIKCGWPQVGVENRDDWVSAVKTLGEQLRACQREKRKMFAAMSPSCNGRYPISGDCKWVFGQHHCSMGVCPNLKRGR